jgi:redox-sensing transcriptional repressor
VKQITKHIIKNSLKRILLYRASILQLRNMGVNKVFSYVLGQETGSSSAQVRKDFSEYKIKGKQRGGYNIDELLLAMENIFHKETDHNIILIGMGNIGTALAKYTKFVHRRINIVATFDIDPSKQSRRSEIPVYSMSRLEEIIERFQIKVAIIAVPEISAQNVCDQLIRLGIKGIVNFAPIILKTNEKVIINNVNLSDEIEAIIFYVVNEQKRININT